MATTLEMTQAEYARHRGVSRQAVGKLIDGGKIPFREQRGKKLIDVAGADHRLGEVQERVVARDAPEDEDIRGEGRTYAPASDGAGLTKAKTATEVYRARIAQLEYEERVGRLVQIDDVTRSMERCAEAIIREIDQLPARADDLASAFTNTGIAGLRKALKDISLQVRTALADNMRLLQATEPDSDDETS